MRALTTAGRTGHRTRALALTALLGWGTVSAQVLFYSDQFNGGVLSGGFSVGTVGTGSGSFTMPVPAGASIRQAWFFGCHLGAGFTPITVDLNGTPWTFDVGQLVSPPWNSIYGGTSGEYAIDVTATLSPLVTNYTITVPPQASTVSNTWTEFYLVIAYDLPGASQINVDLWLNDQDAAPQVIYNLNTSAQLLTSADIGLAILGGYASAFPDCEQVTVNGTLLGTFWGPDFNSVDPNWGTMGAMAYENNTLTGLGDDNADQAIYFTDVVSDLSAVVPNGSTALTVEFDHCSGGSSDNHIFLLLLAYSSDPCDIVLDLGPDTVLCDGASLVLNALQGVPAGYTWQDGSALSQFTVTQTGDYYVDVTSGLCTRSDTIHVDVLTTPVFSLGPDTTICTGGSVTLDATAVPAGTPTWSNGSMNTTLAVSTTGQYWVEVDNGGCSASDTVQVTVVPAPPALLPATADICQGDSVLLDAGGPPDTFLWNTGATDTAIYAITAGTYSVTATYGTCNTVDSTVVTVHALPGVQLGPDTSLCVGEEWPMSAGNPGANYLWSTGSTAQLDTVSTPQTVWVNVTDAFGCTGSDTIAVTFDPLPVVVLTSDTACIDGTITFDAGNPGSTYLWSNGNTGQTVTVTDSSATYSVVVTTPTICVDSASVQATFLDFPPPSLDPDTALCAGEVLVIDAHAPGMDLTWSDGSHGPTYTLTSDDTVLVDISNGFCVTRDTIVVVFNPLPVPITDQDRDVCFDPPPHHLELDAGNPGCTYLWNTGETTQHILAERYGAYSVTITTQEGCSINGTIDLVEYCPPAIWMPSAFTPDADGVNDLFGPIGHNIATVELDIFDRWGELVYTGKDGDALWDGTVGGSLAPDGVYVWKIAYRFITDALGSQGNAEEAVGHVTLLR
ncbi:MAG: gliding motility-associated C-terminal domain-containing protein [Flavobacteriales bacterium]|nr:gliding motility-associated C-terminal domain-containing protein [Flavobacteriales bacterium]MCB9167491.1 gliding motility-associated C-terminal domain-containing protein [Flavobacteriales bacterium]